ncbi:MAG: fibronectin type III domain-containing protein [Halanaerobiales bacterium]|nr:fibronectin type III domain-containing protein [Halanaerobiales bacterium]
MRREDDIKISDLNNNTFNYTLDAENGEHLFIITAIDSAGNSSEEARKKVIFDNLGPAQIKFSDNKSDYFSNSGTGVTFKDWYDNWSAIDRPTDVENSGIARYEVEYTAPGISGSQTIYSNDNPSVYVDLKDYNKQVTFKVWAIDGVGKVGPTAEITWYSLPEPAVISNDWDIKVVDLGSGVYQQTIKLDIPTVKYSYYKVYRYKLTEEEATQITDLEDYIDKHVPESISANLTPDGSLSWSFNQVVEPRATYIYQVKTFNPDHQASSTAKKITIPNNEPDQLVISVSGLSQNGNYLTNDNRNTTITVSSFDYDNDDLVYTYLIKKDGVIKYNETITDTTYQLTDLTEGSTYLVEVTVSDGHLTKTSSKTFTVDTTVPDITVTEPDLHYVASKEINITASDDVSGVATLKYKWGEDGTYQDVPADHIVSAILNGINHLFVKAVDSADNESFVESEYLLDLTPPNIDNVNIQGQLVNGSTYITSNSVVYINFQFSDDLTAITSYRYGLLEDGESISSILIDQLPEVIVSGTSTYLGQQQITANLVDGKRYYPVFAVYNEVERTTGLVQSETGFTVDGSGPEVNNLTVTGLTNTAVGIYLTDKLAIGFTPTATDSHSGVKDIKYGITKTTGTEPLNWEDSFLALKSSLNLVEGQTYYLAVKAENEAGLSTIEYTDGFVVDTEEPAFSSIIGGKEMLGSSTTYTQHENDHLNVTWSVNDISAIIAYYYKIGTSAGSGNISQDFSSADSSGWVALNTTDYTQSLTISESDYTFDDGTYYITLKAIDAAGNIATATTNSIKIDSSLPPVPDVNTDGVYVSENDKIHFTIEMDNPAQEVIGYRYRIVDDLNNILLNWQEIVSSELKLDIIEDDSGSLKLTDGERYFVEAQAKYQDGSYTDSGWANVTIDSVAPQITELNHPNYASSESLTISWLAEEDYSELTYKVKIGSSSGEGDILGWRSLGRNTQHTFDELQIDDGEIVYITLYAEDGSGLSTTDISGPVIIDNTAPPIPVVIDGGLYTNDDTQLSVSWTWTQTDPESGIGKYEIALLTSKEVHGNIEWIPVNAEVTEYTFYDSLQHNTVYFVAVKSINRAGKSSIGFSDGILVDITKPNPPSIDDFGDYTATQNSLIAQLSGAYDPESGIASFYYSLGTLDNLTLLVANKEVTGTTVVGEEFSTEIDNNGKSLAKGTIYFFKAVAKNGAGDISASTMSDGIMVLDGTQPKVSKIIVSRNK